MTMIDTPAMSPSEAAQRQGEKIEALQQRMEGLFHRDGTKFATRPVELNGVHFESATVASYATGIPEKAIRERCAGRQESYRDAGGRKVQFFARYVKPLKGGI